MRWFTSLCISYSTICLHAEKSLFHSLHLYHIMPARFGIISKILEGLIILVPKIMLVEVTQLSVKVYVTFPISVKF